MDIMKINFKINGLYEYYLLPIKEKIPVKSIAISILTIGFICLCIYGVKKNIFSLNPNSPTVKKARKAFEALLWKKQDYSAIPPKANHEITEIDWIPSNEWWFKTNKEILDIFCASPCKTAQYRTISPSTVTDVLSALHSVVQGARPLGIVSGDLYYQPGMEEGLKKAGLGILKFEKVTQEDVNNGLRNENFNGEFNFYKVGDYRSWIVYRLGYKEHAKELAKILLSKDFLYRDQRIGRLLFYKEEEIKNFCQTHNISYLEGQLPPLKVEIDDFDYEIFENNLR